MIMATERDDRMMPDKWTGSFVLDNVEYRCMAANPHPVHRMGGLMMDLGRTDYVDMDSSHRSIVIQDMDNEPLIAYNISSVNKYCKPVTDEHVLIGIYRKGEPEPVYFKEHGVEGDTLFDQAWDCHIGPGEYFLAMGNIAPYDHLLEKFERAGDYTIFRLRILEHGSKTNHPALVSADIMADRSLNLMLYLDTEIEHEQLYCECYDEDFRLVGDTDFLHLQTDEFSSYVTFKLNEKSWWTDGRYHLIIYHNREPYAYVEFSTGECKNRELKSGFLPRCSVHYKLCTDVERFGHKFMFCRLNGCGKFKRKVLEHLDTSHSRKPRHLMLADGGKPDYDVTRTAAGILHPYYGYARTTVKELMEETMKETDPVERLDAMLARRSTVIYGLEALTDPANEIFARMLLDVAADAHGLVVLYGTEHELKRLLKMYPEWMEHTVTPSWWNVYEYTQRDAMHTVEQVIARRKFTTNGMTRQKLEQVLQENWETVRDWRQADYEQWFETEVLHRVKSRVLKENSFSDLFLHTVLEEDVVMTIRKEQPAESYGHCLSGLDRMVGLKEVKDHLKLLFKRMDFDRKREALGLRKLHTGVPHMVFTGNPGTGKTTVAKLVGQAFRQLGYLSKGEVVTVERSQMVGQYIGETERRMTDLLKKAKGNVMFIDEAYSLSDNGHGDRKDFGCRVLECLLPVLADDSSDMVVIMAGYEKEMKQMMELNPGMRGRFPYWFRFEDYDTDELHNIAIRLLEDNDFRLTYGADGRLRNCIREALDGKDRFFHNARWIHQLVHDGLLTTMAGRLHATEPSECNRDLFCTVTEEDVRAGYERMCPSGRTALCRRVGFR